MQANTNTTKAGERTQEIHQGRTFLASNNDVVVIDSKPDNINYVYVVRVSDGKTFRLPLKPFATPPNPGATNNDKQKHNESWRADAGRNRKLYA